MNLKNPIARLNLVLWQPLAGYSLSFLSLFGLLVYRLGSLLPGFSSSEQMSIMLARNLNTIFNNPLFAPHSFLQYLSLKSGHFGFIAMRLPSVLLAITGAWLFFYVASRWFNFRVAVVSTILFVTSSWFLFVARSATPEVSLLGLIAPIAYSVWLPKTRRTILALILGSITLVTMLYIPGFIWFTVFGVLWQRQALVKLWRDARVPTLFALCACVIVLTPLIIKLSVSSDLLKAYAGLPENITQAVRQLPKNIALIPVRLVVLGPADPEVNLGRLPLLDIFTAVMAVIGAYSYATHAKLRRSRLLLAIILISSVLIGLQGLITIAILLPFIFLLVASGINFMLEQWFLVFPYNPFARSLATVLITIALLVTGFFHINRYFIAWPQTTATKEVYQLRPQRP